MARPAAGPTGSARTARADGERGIATAAPIAALARPALRERLSGKRMAVLVSGGNLMPETLRAVLNAQLALE